MTDRMSPPPRTPADLEKPRIHLIATGGTIAGVQAESAGLGYRAGALPLAALVQAVPNLNTLATLTSEQFCNIGSQDMDEAIWLRLARRISTVLADHLVDGVVVTHGTDTIEETAFFLSSTIASEKPVVLVGAMRPATAIDADGPRNLADAIAVAANPAARQLGVLVVMNGTIHAATSVEKRHTSRLDALAARSGAEVGSVRDGQVSIAHSPAPRSTSALRFGLEYLSSLPRVDIVYAYAGLRRDVIDDAVACGAQGIVLAGVGAGNASESVLAGLSDAAAAGVVVVRSSRVGTGVVERNQEIDDDRLGFVAALGFSPPKARILLMLGLTWTHDPGVLQGLFRAHSAH